MENLEEISSRNNLYTVWMLQAAIQMIADTYWQEYVENNG